MAARLRLRRRLAVAIAGLLTVALVQVSPLARAAAPASGSVGAAGDRVTWTGGPFTVSNVANVTDPCSVEGEPGCDRFTLTVSPQTEPTTLAVTVATADGGNDDYDVYVYQDGVRVAESAHQGTPPETLAIPRPSGTYEIRVQAFQVLPGSTYRGEAALLAGGNVPYGDDERVDPTEDDCLEPVPDKLGIAGVTDDGRRVSLDVTVLVDEGISEQRARQVMTAAKESYAPLAIDLNVTRYLLVDVPDDGTATKAGLTVGTAQGDAMIAFAKRLFGGVRPPDSDVVYTLTNKDLYTLTEEATATGETDDDGDGRVDEDKRDYGLLGLADCIGGVRYDDHAFATGELGDELGERVGPASFLGNVGAKTAAHEIGHLLGAHHHYFDCAEGLLTETTEGEVSPCTIMAPFADLGSINFGVLDGAVVRGHADAYAGDNDAAAAAARTAPGGSQGPGATGPGTPGYALLGQDGGIFTFGGATFHGSTGDRKLNQPVVGMAWTPTGAGYWIVAKDGGIFTFGDAAFHGSTGGMALNAPILGMEGTPTGRGYWLVAGDGGIFTFGDAKFQGSMGDRRLNAPVVGLGTTRTGGGYWLVASDGGIFTFGDAVFHGSTGDRRLNEPVFDLAATPSDAGYWLVARDGGVFTFGDAGFQGSAAAPGKASVVGLDATGTGAGYWIADRAGTVAAFGDAPVLGDLTGQRLNAPIVGFAATT